MCISSEVKRQECAAICCNVRERRKTIRDPPPQKKTDWRPLSQETNLGK